LPGPVPGFEPIPNFISSSSSVMKFGDIDLR
jgi:hypothetical protein